MRLAYAISLTTLAGCVSQPSGVQAQFEAFATDAASAEIMADICPQYTMRASLEVLTEGFLDQMRAAGYSELEVLDGIRATPEDRVIDRVIAEMAREGVTPGNQQSLCAYADREVAEGSQIGCFLQ